MGAHMLLEAAVSVGAIVVDGDRRRVRIQFGEKLSGDYDFSELKCWADAFDDAIDKLVLSEAQAIYSRMADIAIRAAHDDTGEVKALPEWHGLSDHDKRAWQVRAIRSLGGIPAVGLVGDGYHG